MNKGERVGIQPSESGVVVDFARSELFERTFEEGMELVEETASYLDGGGRQESKTLSRAGALAYASESMRLTTALMQVASWLLVQRAVREGEMSPESAREDRYRLAAQPAVTSEPAPRDTLPAHLIALLDRSSRLYDRVSHLDKRMYVDTHDIAAPAGVLGQMDRLRGVFGH